MKAVKNFYVLKSSAGSGKTYALVKHYLMLALQTKSPFYYKQILAITFTNAAAAEMKERVIRRLTEFRDPISLSKGDKTLFEEIRTQLDIPAHELHHRADQTLVHMLHNYGLISISTIDSFTHRIVRSFAKDLRLHPDFTIEMDTTAFSEKIVDACLDQIGTDPELTSYLEQFTLENYEDEKGSKVRSALESVTRQLYNEDSKDVIEHLQTLSLDEYGKIRQRLRDKINDFEKPLREISEHVFMLMDSVGLSVDDFAYKNSGPIGNFIKYANGDFKLPGSRLIGEAKGSRWYSKTVSADTKARIESIESELDDARLAIIDHFEENDITSYRLTVQASKVIYSMGMLARLSLISKQLKEDENILLINDFQAIIAEIVNDSPAPFIYERVGERYNHILFDEFQDTSGLQWNNFLPLIENSLSKGNFNLIVGDGKQAIYRWRNGKAEQFVNLPKLSGNQPPERRQALEYAYEKGELKKNFRSARTIIRYNNDLFASIVEQNDDGKSSIAKVYEGQEQEEVRDIEGYVNVTINEFKKEEKLAFTLKTVVDKVKESIEDGYLPGDIAILTRKGASESAPIAAALHEAGFQVVTKESFLLSNSPKVRLVMSFMKYLTQPDHLYSQVGIWQNLCLLYPDKYNLRDLISSFAVQRDKYIIPNMSAFLEAYYPTFNEISVLRSAIEIAENAIQLFKIVKDPFLEFLLDHLTRLSTQRDYSLQEILEWWEDNREALYTTSQAGSDSINILTVHKSKGLQYPVVIYPRFSSKEMPNTIWLDVDADEFGVEKILYTVNSGTIDENTLPAVAEDIRLKKLDDINLAYVACTRPENRLYIILESERANELTKQMMTWSSELEFGVREKFNSKEKKESPRVSIQGIIGPNIQSVSLRYTVSKEKILSKQEQRLLGNVIHDCLAHIALPADIAGAMKKVMPRYPMISESRHTEIASRLLEIVNHENFRRWFVKEVPIFNEQEIVLADGSPVRPDRVMVYDEYWEVVDFKTGAPNVKHHDQVYGYMMQLESISGKPVKGYLAYTSDYEVVEVTRD
jgi:ATP-dependent exoDNAse (exonuclease V) beta subunit